MLVDPGVAVEKVDDPALGEKVGAGGRQNDGAGRRMLLQVPSQFK